MMKRGKTSSGLVIRSARLLGNGPFLCPISARYFRLHSHEYGSQTTIRFLPGPRLECQRSARARANVHSDLGFSSAGTLPEQQWPHRLARAATFLRGVRVQVRCNEPRHGTARDRRWGTRPGPAALAWPRTERSILQCRESHGAGRERHRNPELRQT